MATRSTIALEYADGTVDQIYCHWDGYLENNGQLLQEYYLDPFKLQRLMDLGDLSSLGESIGDKHDFDCPHKYGTPEYEAWSDAKSQICTFYGRDRGETGCGARRFKNFEEYKREMQREEYDYVLRNVNGKPTWFVSFYGTDDEFLTMQEAYEFQAAQKEEA